MNQVCVLVFLCLVAAVSGFVVPSPVSSKGPFVPRTAATSSQMMAAKKEEPTRSFWEGEWVCADCGYIYDIDDCGGLYLEEQKRGFVCPQCRGPRRRFAKKVGNQVGVTQDGGDAPILVFSFLGLAGTVAFGYWFAGQ